MARPKLTEHQRAIVEKNLPIVYGYIKRYKHMPWVRAFPSHNDARQSATIALCEAVQTHDPAKGTLTTVAFLAIHRRLRRDSRRQHHIHVPKTATTPHSIRPMPTRDNTPGTNTNRHTQLEDIREVDRAIVYNITPDRLAQTRDSLRTIKDHLDDMEHAIVIGSYYLHNQDPPIHEILQIPLSKARSIRKKAIVRIRQTMGQHCN